MIINKTFLHNIQQKSTDQNTSFRNLNSPSYDTVSFGAMKKSQFKGIDALIINQFKAPIEKFDSNEDLQNWCTRHIEEIKRKNYEGRQFETKIQRKNILNEWYDYVLNENGAYSKSIALLILSGLTKELKPDEDKLLPTLNKGVLAQTIEQIQDLTQNNPNLQVSFIKTYNLNLQKSLLNDMPDNVDESQTGWVEIPSFKHAPENFKSNVEKLKALSHNNWCTKSFNAEPYLTEGDFHIYLEQGRPKLGVRFNGDFIEEIQGEKNNSRIPLKYFDIAKEHVKNKNLNYKTKTEIEEVQNRRTKLNEFLSLNFPKGVENYSIEEILNKIGIVISEKDKDGVLTLESYHQPNKDISFEDLGINENDIFKNVKAIKGDANFRSSSLTDTGKLEYIGGNANFNYTRLKNTGNIKYIGGSANFGHSKIESLANLVYIGKDCLCAESNVANTGKLEYIGRDANFRHSKLKDTGNIKYIGKDADFSESEIRDLKVLKEIGRDAFFNHSYDIKFENLKRIGRDVFFVHSDIKNLGSIEEIGGNLVLKNSKIFNLGSLKKIGGKAVIYKKDKNNPIVWKLKSRLLPIEFDKEALWEM